MWKGRRQRLASPSKFLDFLGQFPTLESLRLVHCLPNFLQQRPKKRVALPHLNKLTLSGGLPDILRTMASLIILRSTTVELGLQQRPKNQSTFRKLFSVLVRHLGGSSKPSVHVEFICQEPSGEIVHGEYPIKIRRYTADDTLETKPALLDMLGAHDKVHRVYAEMFVGASLCESLGAFRDGENWLVEGTPDIADALPPAERAFFLPNLSSLILRDVDFDEMLPDFDDQLPLRTVFVRHLKARQAAGTVLDTLRLKNCISEDWGWLEGLEGAVRSVTGLDHDTLHWRERDKLDEDDDLI
ncbi:hypothetical protein BV25DRAFT_1899105 [Artomyces pyxidatus]|uniref:Uncharacterized protein n=1 Tax=Artomyces pyxidatus TaxID=48021 RepID=A0ACB8T5V8_9AGAM|nr:hypothetical protein BV25DRAFT_1899105 [Artomyces pyxidatus]